MSNLINVRIPSQFKNVFKVSLDCVKFMLKYIAIIKVLFPIELRKLYVIEGLIHLDNLTLKLMGTWRQARLYVAVISTLTIYLLCCIISRFFETRLKCISGRKRTCVHSQNNLEKIKTEWPVIKMMQLTLSFFLLVGL